MTEAAEVMRTAVLAAVLRPAAPLAISVAATARATTPRPLVFEWTLALLSVESVPECAPVACERVGDFGVDGGSVAVAAPRALVLPAPFRWFRAPNPLSPLAGMLSYRR